MSRWTGRERGREDGGTEDEGKGLERALFVPPRKQNPADGGGAGHVNIRPRPC